VQGIRSLFCELIQAWYLYVKAKVSLTSCLDLEFFLSLSLSLSLPLPRYRTFFFLIIHVPAAPLRLDSWSRVYHYRPGVSEGGHHPERLFPIWCACCYTNAKVSRMRHSRIGLACRRCPPSYPRCTFERSCFTHSQYHRPSSTTSEPWQTPRGQNRPL
jgi:hypothetical protein